MCDAKMNGSVGTAGVHQPGIICVYIISFCVIKPIAVVIMHILTTVSFDCRSLSKLTKRTFYMHEKNNHFLVNNNNN